MKTVTVYSTPTCTFCKELKEYLKSKNVQFEELDVLANPNALEDMQTVSGGSTSVPVIVFQKGKQDQSMQIGFNEEAMAKELGL